VRALRDAKARTDEKTGLHVHIGGEKFTGKTVAILLKLIYKQEELVFAAPGVSEERRTRYTRPIDPQVIARIERSRPQTLQQMNRVWYGTFTPNPPRYHESRYHIVNVNSLFVRGTIEFRAYTSGNLHAGKIKAAILQHGGAGVRALLLLEDLLCAGIPCRQRGQCLFAKCALK